MADVFMHAIVGGDPDDPLGNGARPLCGDPAPFGFGGRDRTKVGCAECLALLDLAQACRDNADDADTVRIRPEHLAVALVLRRHAENAAVPDVGNYLVDNVHESTLRAMRGEDYGWETVDSAAFELGQALRRFELALRKAGLADAPGFDVPRFPNAPPTPDDT